LKPAKENSSGDEKRVKETKVTFAESTVLTRHGHGEFADYSGVFSAYDREKLSAKEALNVIREMLVVKSKKILEMLDRTNTVMN